MSDLFSNELARFRKPAMFIGFLVLVILAYYSSITPIMANKMEVEIFILLSILLGLGFGIYQMYFYKKPSQWTFLIHRPIEPSKIFYSVTGAAIAVIIIAITLPFLALFVGLDVGNVDIVEGRHYMFVIHITMLVLVSYFIGVYTILNPSWIAFAAIGLLYFMIATEPVLPETTLFKDVICLAIVWYLAKESFKVNLSKDFTDKKTLFVAVIASHSFLCFLALFSQMIFYHIPLFIVDKHPDNYPKEQLTEYYSILWHVDGEELVELVVDESNYPDKATLLKQVKNAQDDSIKARFDFPKTKGQIFHMDEGYESYAIVDKKNKTKWFFSHNEGVYIGKHQRTGEVVGYLTPQGFIETATSLAQLNDKQRFDEVPTHWGNKYVRTFTKLYTVDFDDKYFELKHQLPEGEFYTQYAQYSEHSGLVAMTSNKAVYLFNRQAFEQLNVEIEPQMRIQAPKVLNNLQYLSYFDLLDGYLVTFPSSDYFGREKPGIGLIYAKHSGEQILVSEKAFKQYRPLPPFVSNQEIAASPIGMGLIFTWIDGLSKHPEDREHYTVRELLQHRFHQDVYIGMAILMLISLVTVFWIQTKRKASASDTLFWLTMILLFSFIGLVSFLMLVPWRHLIIKPKKLTQQANDSSSPSLAESTT